MSIGYYRVLTEQDLLRYIQNPNAFILLARREAVLNKPTHYAYYYDYPDSSIALREGFKEALHPLDLSSFPLILEEAYNKRNIPNEH